MFVNIIVVYERNLGIGLNNSLPWKISSDLKKFKELTIGNKKNGIIMGKNTWLSLNKKSLIFRDNLILSKTLTIDEEDKNNNITKSFKNEEDLKEFIDKKNYEELWIIGGANIYDLFLNKTNILKINKIYVTLIDEEIECDTFFPLLNKSSYSFMSKSIHNSYNKEYNIYDIIYKNNGNKVVKANE
tara:strand:+ start:228 stop:785 length:558 start_codon:yes stop_codon:yes gene_type:complete